MRARWRTVNTTPHVKTRSALTETRPALVLFLFRRDAVVDLLGAQAGKEAEDLVRGVARGGANVLGDGVP